MDPFRVSRIGAVTIQRIIPEASKQSSSHTPVFSNFSTQNDSEIENEQGIKTGTAADRTAADMEVDEDKPVPNTFFPEESDTMGPGFGRMDPEQSFQGEARMVEGSFKIENHPETLQNQSPKFRPGDESGSVSEPKPESDRTMVGNENESNDRSEVSTDSRTSGGGEEASNSSNKADSKITQNNFSEDINKKLGRFGFSVSVSEVKIPSSDQTSIDEALGDEAPDDEGCEDPNVEEPKDEDGLESIENLVSSLSEQSDQFKELKSNVEFLDASDFKKEIFSEDLDSETAKSDVRKEPNQMDDEQKMDVANDDVKVKKEDDDKEGDEASEEDDETEGDGDGGDEKDLDDKDSDKPKKKHSKKKKTKKSPSKEDGESTSSDSGSDSEKKKRKKAGVLNMRRNIREVMDETQLDESTLNAQRQEAERLRRVQEQQRIIREVQRQIAINRQQNKTQTRVISLLQGGSSSSKTTVTSSSSSKPSTVVVKVSSGSGSTQIVNKKVLDLLKSQKSGSDSSSEIRVTSIPRSFNKPHMVTPSVSIAPVQAKAISTTPEDLSDEENLARAAIALKKKAAAKKDVVTISSSSGSEDDCIVISEPSAGEESEQEDDPTNSGMHTNDTYNVPDEQGRVLINVGHPESEPDVFLSPQIARIIKPHQIGGVRFLFDNIVESLERYKTSTGFGCILAHSMGLGKTLQVVSFCDVFLRYTEGKSVMCIMPINTLQNWVAEFNHWLPLPAEAPNSPLAADGEVRPREFQVYILNDFQKSITARAKVIQEWKKEGGVLLIGYELYRQLSLKKPRKPRNKKQKEEEIPDDKAKPLLEEMYEALVKPGPDLVICDEGHRIKNSHASISQALKQIRSRRRVVLTGYPLQNNLLEYWCMVDFVRPNYLGSKTEFSNMFERPIQNGQCVDSTPQDVRLMRYRAHVLHSLLEGFVQRRSHSVLQQALPQKEEYILLVRMTPFQRKLYETFMNEVVRIKAVPNPLKAFAVCCKIWNHPDILYNFLKKKEEVDLDLVEAAACLGTPGSMTTSVPPTPPTPTTKGGKRSRAKDPSAAAKKDKKPRKGAKGANDAENTPAVATVLPNVNNNAGGSDQSLLPFNYNNQNNSSSFNANSSYPDSGNYNGFEHQQFPGHIGTNYNNPSQQPYDSFNYNQSNYPSQSPLPGATNQPGTQQHQAYYPPGYQDQSNYWQDNSNLYPNNSDPHSEMNYYGNSDNGFYDQNNSNFSTSNNMYNQSNYARGCYDNNSSVSANMPTPDNPVNIPSLPNVGNSLSDTSNNLDSFANKDSRNFSCLSNPPSVPAFNNVTDNVHNIVNSNLGLTNLPNNVDPVDSLMNTNLAANNCESGKNSGNFHGLPGYQGNLCNTNMMSSIMNESVVDTVNNPASNSNVMQDAYNSISSYGNQQFNNYPARGNNFPPHQMDVSQNLPYNHLADNQPGFPSSENQPGFSAAKQKTDFSPKKELDSNIFPSSDSTLNELGFPFKSESKEDIKDLPTVLFPSKEEIKSETKEEIKDELKPDCAIKDKKEVTAADSQKDNSHNELGNLADGTKKDVTSVVKSTFESPASKKEDPGIPYDWAIKLLEDYVPGLIDSSPKMAIFFCIVEESIAMRDRILVFSQSLFTLNLIEDFLQRNYIPGTDTYWAKNWSYYRLDGSTTASEREKLINEFNANDQVHMFLVSTRAGSLGINLVGANRVIVFDASWNPCHDTQAVCRVYRYGQQKPCFVYRLVMDNCLEKKIYDRQINKQGMADRVVDECNPDAHLSIKEVANLCWDNDEDSVPQDYSNQKDKYSDFIIHKILDNYSHFLSKAPFEHESLLVDRKDKKLSTAEKRLAKRSYELEKQANTRPTYNFVGNQQGLQIRSMTKPMASVRPMQSENSLTKDGNSKWIPAEVWQKQGMSAQEMTLPLDVVIPTNSADRSSIVLNAGQKVMVLKSPKGIYMQLENGKIIAIRTAYKVGAGGAANKGTEKKVFPAQPQTRQIPLNRPPFDRNVRGLEGRREISVSPIRGRGQAVPGLLRNNSSISITPRTVPVTRNVAPGAKHNGGLIRLLGPKSRTTNVRLPVIKDSNVSVTITKRNPTTSNANLGSGSFSTPPSSEHLERDSSYHSRLETKAKQVESKGTSADFSDNLSQSPGSSSSSSFSHQMERADSKSVGTEPADFKESGGLSQGTCTSSSSLDSIYNEPTKSKLDVKMASESVRTKLGIKSPEYKHSEGVYHESIRSKIDIKPVERVASEPVRTKIDIKPSADCRPKIDIIPSNYKQMDKVYYESVRSKVDVKASDFKQTDSARPKMEIKQSEPARQKIDMKASEYRPLDKMKNLSYSQSQAIYPPVNERPSGSQGVDKSKFPSLPNISFNPVNTSQKNYRPTSHQRSTPAMNSTYRNDMNRMPETSPALDFKKPTSTTTFNSATYSGGVVSDLQQMPQQYKNPSPYSSSEKPPLTKDTAFQNLKQRGSISIIPMDKGPKPAQTSLHSQTHQIASGTNQASQLPLNPEYDYRSMDSGVESFSSPAYRSDYYSDYSQPVSSAPASNPQIYSHPSERSSMQSHSGSYDMYQQPYSSGNVDSSGGNVGSYGSTAYNQTSYDPSAMNQQMNQQMYSAFHRPEPIYPSPPSGSYQNAANSYQYDPYYTPYPGAPDNSSLPNPQRPQ
nr:PREDICTED: uncharacterized protein LOC109040022 isoform X1 [Bemisia tabaci]XP_018911324.1 PREDICTED: uncharacterized protein LOC109040022 isoform X1 [Bemisia tabaci]